MSEEWEQLWMEESADFQQMLPTRFCERGYLGCHRQS